MEQRRLNNKRFSLQGCTLVTLIGCATIIMVLVSMDRALVQAQQMRNANKVMLSQFEDQQNWSDANAKDLFSYLYSNAPDRLKERVLAKYRERFANEATAVSRERVVEITNAIMPAAMSAALKAEVNAEMQKFISYQNKRTR